MILNKELELLVKGLKLSYDFQVEQSILEHQNASLGLKSLKMHKNALSSVSMCFIGSRCFSE